MKTLVNLCLVALLAICLGMMPKQALATLITSIPEGSVVNMSTVAFSGEADSSVRWSSDNWRSVFNYSGAYGFTRNGFWSGLPMSGLNSDTGTMTFTFDNPVSWVGGFLNYVPNAGISPTIAIYDSNGAELESATLAFNTGGGYNTGAFYGFSHASISSFTLSDAYIGITNLTIGRWGDSSETNYPGVPDESGNLRPTAVTPVPEPSTVLLFAAGLLGVGLVRRRVAK